MPNIKSKEKRLKQSKVRNLRNKSFKSKMNTAIKNANTSAQAKDINYAVSLVDSAVTKKILKKNTASRKKSKLQKITVKEASK